MNIITHNQLLSTKVETMWLVEGLIKSHSIGFVAGEPKTCKSWLSLHIAQGVATGQPVLGHFRVPSPARVLFVEEEDAYETVISRLKALSAGHASPEPREGNLNFMVLGGFKADNEASLTSFIDTARRAGGADLVIFDVLNKMHSGHDSDQKHMTKVMRAFERVREALDCAVLIVHHFGKGSKSKRGNQRLRGSSVLSGWSENSLYLSKPGPMVLVEPESKFSQTENFGFLFRATGQGVELVYGSFSQADEARRASPLLAWRDKNRKRELYKKKHHVGGR